MFLTFLQFLFSNFFYFALHFKGCNSFPKPLKLDEEIECFRQLNTEKSEKIKHAAKDKLILHNMRLVAHIMKKYYTSSNESEDLISIGTIGLIKAVSSFDYKKGAKFATFASKCIENEILMHFRNLKKNNQDVYINDTLDTDKDGNNLTLIEKIVDKTDVQNEIETKIRIEEMKTAILKVLTQREKQVLTLRYGIGEKMPLTQNQVADKLKISRSYVSRIETKAVEKLKNELEKQ